MMFSGLIVRNVGKKTAFKAVLTCEGAAKVRLHFRDMPIQKIDPGQGESITIWTEYLNDNGLWYAVGGTLGQQVQSCFDWLNDEGIEETILVVIVYADYEGREYSTRCVIKRDRTVFSAGRIWCELVSGSTP